ncbi:MAG: peptide chain release factor 1 [Myxococcales bacterium]|nr:peptide chain release factor 1 [Myxococcales bacterium]
MLPVAKLEAFVRRAEELDRLLCDPEATTDPARYRKLSKERAELEGLVDSFAEYQKLQKQLDDDRKALEDPELRELVVDEIPELERQLAALSRALTFMLLPADPADERNVVLEIRAAEGGDEATLFAADLFRMYLRFAEKMRWQVELLSESKTLVGGLKEVIATISGDRVYSTLRFEGGVHRVQRVPATEAQGRVHTSTATVAVLPEAEEVDVQIDEAKDLQISIAASGGPGGQGVNTTNSAVQIIHKPSGILVKCQDERSQLKNKAKAMKILRARLLEVERRRREESIGDQRRGMVGSGERAEKIRTYNFPQNRVSDHRIQLTLYKLDRFIDGQLDELLTPLRTHHQADRLRRELGIETGLGVGGSSPSDD